MKIKSVFIALVAFIFAALISACGASGQESVQTWSNRQEINSAIPVPAISFSSRRLVLAKFYLVLERSRLNTCTYISGYQGGAIIPTFGPSVNLSNQMTNPVESEPDSVYTGTNDQTLIVLRNGNFATVEDSVTTVGGDCPSGVRVDSALQIMLENASGITPEFDFTNTDGLSK